MTGRVVIVTGASAGLGYEVARYLCEGGNDVILACRNEEKANRAIEKIKRTNPNALATFIQLDLASSESIKKFVDDFHATEKSLHVLVNNAGVSSSFKDTKRQFTKENFEITMGTNHLGHFLLTTLLLDDLKKTGAEENGDARIVTVTSSVHDPEANRRKNLQPLDFENFFLYNKGTHNGLQAYKNSKAANLLFTYELAKKLDGTNVTANAVCPGFVPGTELQRSSSGAQKFFTRYVLHGMLRFTKMTRSVQQGAQAIITLATDDKYKGVSGKYVKDGAETKSSAETLDEEKQAKLWAVSGGYLALDGYEAIEVTVPPPEEPEPKKKEEKKEEAKPEGGDKEEGGEDKPAATEDENKEEDKPAATEDDDDLKKDSDEKPAADDADNDKPAPEDNDKAEEKPEESQKPAPEEEKPAAEEAKAE